MGLKLRLTWFDKKNGDFEGEEYSKDLDDDGSVIENLGLHLSVINNGSYDLQKKWTAALQPHFKALIQIEKYNYYVGFDYRDGDW